MNRSRFVASLGVLIFMLSACSSAKTPATVPEGTITVAGARTAVTDIQKLITAVQPMSKPSGLLGIYADIVLAGGLAVPVQSALAGIDAQLVLHGTPSADAVHDLYTLLEEFGTVLHVDINDLLNRSQDRVKTLDDYSQGLQNITERSRRRSDELKGQITTAKGQEQQQKKVVAALDKEVKSALKAKDYATAGTQQDALAEAQTESTKISLQLKQLMTVQETFKELLTTADARIKAIESNREVLIAGLKVVDIPGVDDLGVLEGAAGKTRKKSGFTPFGGL